MDTQTHLYSIPAGGRSFQLLAFTWLLIALLLTIPVTIFLQGALPLFTITMLFVMLGVFARARNAAAIGFRPLALKELARYAALCLLNSLFLMVIFEPWSRTYRALFAEAVSSSHPDAMFGWLTRFPGLTGWAGFVLYGAFVALFAEEVFFRGWLLNWLKGRMSEWKAILWQAILFTLPQLLAAFLLSPLQGILYAGVYSWLAIGVVNGWAASRTRSIWPGLVSATLYNIVMTAFSL
jgi:membrane protease YdiL (CAAX protease family)